MGLLFNLARMTTATTGNGALLTLGAAVSGYLTFAQAGVADGQVVSYGILDGPNSEIGEGTYIASGTGLSRDTVSNSTASGARITLSGNAQVFITPRAEDLATLGPIVLNKQTVNRNVAIPTDSNGASVGPITVNTGVVVTVPTGCRWMVS